MNKELLPSIKELEHILNKDKPGYYRKAESNRRKTSYSKYTYKETDEQYWMKNL